MFLGHLKFSQIDCFKFCFLLKIPVLGLNLQLNEHIAHYSGIFKNRFSFVLVYIEEEKNSVHGSETPLLGHVSGHLKCPQIDCFKFSL